MNDLGNLQGVYHPSGLTKAIILILGLFFCAVPIAIITNRIFSNARDFSSFSTILILIGIPSALLGVFAFWRFNKSRKCEVRIYENGLYFIDVNGEEHSAKWEEIENLGELIIQHRSYGINTARSFTYTITKTNHEGFLINSAIKNIEEIGKRLKNEANKRNIPIYDGAVMPEYYEQMFH